MAEQTQAYAGELTLGGGPVVYGQVWVQDDTAVLFEQPGDTIAMHELVIGLDDSGRLTFTGQVDGEPAVWTVVPAARSIGRWVAADVMFPEGTYSKATVSWTQYGVEVIATGQPKRLVAGAHTRVAGKFGYIVPIVGDEVQVALNQKRGCGCGK